MNDTLKKSAAILTLVLLSANFLIGQGKTPVRPTKDDRSPVLNAPTPIFCSGNPSCATLNWSTDPAYSHMTEDWALKLDFSPPSGASGPYPFTTGGGRFLLGGAAPEPTKSISLFVSGNTVDWSSNRQITAVIVKGGPNANVYPYNPASFGNPPNGSGLTTPGGAFGISHLEFCFELQTIPTAAPVKLSGRVISLNGRGISGVRFLLMNAATGASRVAYSNVFGYYQFEDLEVGALYQVTATHKRNQFFDSVRTISLSEDLEGFDFVSLN